MGKNLIQQRRGKGSIRFRAKKKTFSVKLRYPKTEGEGEVVKLLNIGAFTAPVGLIKLNNEKFFNIASEGMYEGQKIIVGKNASPEFGNIMPLELIPLGTDIYNIEIKPFEGGKLVRSGGISAKVVKKLDNGVVIMLPSKKEKLLPKKARATIGITAGGGRTDKPIVKAGKMWHMMKAKGKMYPRTSPIKMNAVCHPFGGGRGKNMGKPSTPPRDAPPGRKVGLIRASRTGRKKR